MQGSFDLTTIIFAFLAAFVVWKLRSILGTRTGEEKPPRNPFLNGPAGNARPAAPEAKVIPLPGAANANVAPSAPAAQPAERWRPFAEPGSKVWAGLDAIAAADPSFAVQPFLDGAKSAYEMIVVSFADGDRPVLQNLLAKDVYDSFAAALAERDKRGEKVETTFVAIDNAAIADAGMRGRFAEITLRFSAQMINATRDSSGSVVDGSADKVVEVNDAWSFARDVSSRDPNWKLVSTRRRPLTSLTVALVMSIPTSLAEGFAPLAFADLTGFAADDHAEAFAVFQRSAATIAERRTPLREAVAPSPALAAICGRALALRSPGSLEARRFFEAHFQPLRAKAAEGAAGAGFFTGYYEPIVEGALTRTDAFTAPIRRRPRISPGAACPRGPRSRRGRSKAAPTRSSGSATQSRFL